MKKIMLALEIDSELKSLLDECKKRDGHSRTWHLQRALKNYFKSKKITLVENGKSKQK
jgi:predicted transcriptional regulator